MKTTRYAHNVIFDGEHFLVVGGRDIKKTERCTLNNGLMTCTEQNPELKDCARYPELFLVPVDFCKELS